MININSTDMDIILSSTVNNNNSFDNLNTSVIRVIKDHVEKAVDNIESFLDEEIDYIKDFLYKLDSDTLDQVYFDVEEKTYYGSDIQVILYQFYLDILSSMDCTPLINISNEEIHNNAKELLEHINKKANQKIKEIEKLLELKHINDICNNSKEIKKTIYSFLNRQIINKNNSKLAVDLYDTYKAEIDGYGSSYYDNLEEELDVELDDNVMSLNNFKKNNNITTTKKNKDYLYDDYDDWYDYAYGGYGYGYGYGGYNKSKSTYTYKPYTPKPDYTVDEKGTPLEFEGQEEFDKILKMDQNELKEFLSGYLSSCGYEVINGSGYLYAKGTEKVLLTAHMDRHPSQDKVVSEIQKLKTDLGTVWTSPQGICGDDRCGVWAIMQIIKTKHPSVLFNEDEETGCKGSTAFAATDYCKDLDINYMVQIDRRGSNDLVFYSCDNKEFENWLVEKTGYATARGSYTDIAVLMPVSGIAGVNFSSGYYHEHHKNEYIIIEQIIRTKDTVDKLLDENVEKPFVYIQQQNYIDKHSNKNNVYTTTTTTNTDNSGKKLSYYEKYKVNYNKPKNNYDKYIGKTLKEFNDNITLGENTNIYVYKKVNNGTSANYLGTYNYNSIKTINKKYQDYIISQLYDNSSSSYSSFTLYISDKETYENNKNKPTQKTLWEW